MEHILRFAVADDEDSSFVLVQAIQTGDSLLDLKLVGTEGVAPYMAYIQSAHISGLKSKKASVPDTEWEAILKDVFTQEPVKDVQVFAQVNSESSIHLIIRRSIQGYSSRLGTIVLAHSPDQELELMEWCSKASQASASTKEALASRRHQIAELEKTIGHLKNQLSELMDARTHDEGVLLRKFRDLLNEKKLKIRQQQLIIAESAAAAATSIATKTPEKTEKTKDVADASGDEETTSRLTRSMRGRGRARGRGARAPQQSRPQKRKAPGSRGSQSSSDSESDSGFERMNAGRAAVVKPEHDSEQDTTEGEAGDVTASDTGDEDDNRTENSEPPRQRATRSKIAQAGKDNAITESQAAKGAACDSDGQEDEEVAEPPPARVLPFSTRGKKQLTETLSPVAGEETTADEDEL
ncbi:hypothetical protein HOO65_020762 [Ceratocystis lukuohia]|uniref:DNA repair protein XRCC4 n=1 Tax=Ceratocystis lukuohia TaxID=2019550 RepID=A0ABR4MPQ1_9PEZI